jgi:hypothetical protein
MNSVRNEEVTMRSTILVLAILGSLTLVSPTAFAQRKQTPVKLAVGQKKTLTLTSRTYQSLTRVQVVRKVGRNLERISTISVTLGRFSRGRRSMVISVSKKARPGDYALQGVVGRRAGKLLPYTLHVVQAKQVRQGGNSGSGDSGSGSSTDSSGPTTTTMAEGTGWDAMYTGGNGQSFSKKNAYLLGLASLEVYGEPGASWSSFKSAFKAKMESWRMKEFSFFTANNGHQSVVMSNDKIVVVVFRGSQAPGNTAGNLDWAADANILVNFSLGGTIGVHNGFYLALNSKYASIKNAVVAQGGKNKKVYVTGHSLGGAMALICAYRLQVKDSIGVRGVYTYGCPRTGNASFFLTWGNAGLGTRSWMVRNPVDVVAQIVPAPPYKHVGGVQTYSTGHDITRYCRGIHDGMSSGFRSKLPSKP